MDREFAPPAPYVLADLERVADQLHEIVGSLVDFNAGPPLRCRPLSLALTQIETGLLWLESAIEQVEARLERQAA